MHYPALGLEGQHGFQEGDQLRVLRVENEPVLHALALERHGSEGEALPGHEPVHGTRAVVAEERGLDLVLQQPRLVARRGVAAVGHADAHERVLAALQEAALHVEGHFACVLACVRLRVPHERSARQKYNRVGTTVGM